MNMRGGHVYDRFSAAMVAGVVVMIAIAFFFFLVILEPNAGTAPPVLVQDPVVTVEADK